MTSRALLAVVVVVVSFHCLPNYSSAQTPTRPPGRSTTPPQASTAAGMTNQDVTKMVAAGLSESLVITAIRQAKTRSFDTSADGLVALKKAGVPDAIIAVMLNPDAVPVPAPAALPAPPSPSPSLGLSLPPLTAAKDNVMQPHESGIYAMLRGKLVQLEPTVATSGGVGGKSMMLTGLTMGFKKAKAKASIRGGQASTRVDEQTEFYFYGSSQFNPNEFVLARLERGDDKREIVVGEGGMLGVKNGIRDEDQVTLQISKLESGIYKVVPARDLKAGEYGFINISQSNTPRLWDFGVDR